MTNLQLIAALKARKVPFHVGRRILAMAGLPRGMTWDAIAAKVVEEKFEAKQGFQALEARYRESVVAVEKLVSIYPLSDPEMSATRAAVATAVPDPNDAAVKAYPLLLNENQRVAAVHLQPAFVAIERVENATAYVFSAVRVRVTNEDIQPEILPVAMAGRYAAVFGKLVEHVQFFHAVLVPDKGGSILVLTDNVDMTASERLAAQATVRTAFNTLVGFNCLTARTNLYPAIGRLYATTDGRILNLGSMTDTSMEKREKMHARDLCVRKDPGHEAASKAGVEIAPFGIGVEWTLNSSTNHAATPVLEIQSSSKDALAGKPVVEEASVHKCATYEEFSFVMGKLMEALNPAGAVDA